MSGTAGASLAGTTLGRYRLVEKLGVGGMATVYRAEDPTLGRQVAVKVMHPFIAERSEAGSRFEREAKAVAGLRHPNVMALHDYAPASAEHPAYLVMELLTGPSLQRFLVEHGAPLAEVAGMLGLRIAQALGAAHAHGIVHRDVKPENVMFDGHRVVLCDFGIARVAAAEGVTATGAVLGSPAYMSPEQASGGEIDARSDQFSLGALLYQLATGALPFSGTTPLVTMAKIVKGEHAPPTAKNARVPPYLERVIERLLRPAPDERFPSVDACAEALREGLAADGFADVDGELAAYLRDPAGYNAAVERRVVDAALAQAEAARARGETARALAAAGRVLAWRPEEARALAVAAGVTARWRRRVVVAVASAGVVVAVGGMGWRAMRRAGGAGGTAAGTVATIGAGDPTPRPPPNYRPPADKVASTDEPPMRVASAPAEPSGSLAEPAAPRAEPSTSHGEPTTRNANPSAPGVQPKPPSPLATAVVKKAHHPRLLGPTPPTGATAAPPTNSTNRPPTIPTAAPPTTAAAAPSTAPSTTAPPNPAADAPATLAVAIAPWCDLTVDGHPRGRSPTTLSLPPGQHRIVCVNPVSQQRLTRDLTLAPAERRELRERLYATVRVTPRLARGDAFAVDGAKPASAAAAVEPGRRRVTLYKAGAAVETRWLDVPPGGCTLVDAPQLACDKP